MSAVGEQTYVEGVHRTFEEAAEGALTGKEGHFVKLGTAENTVELCETPGSEIGIMDGKAQGGKDVRIRLLTGGGTVRVRAGGVIAKGARIKCGTGGKAVAASGSDIASLLKLSQGSSADGDFIEALFGFVNPATVEAGGISATHLASDAVETAKIKDANVTAGKLANAVADIIPVPSVAIANTGTPDGVANVTFQLKDAQGNNLAARALVRFWFAETAYAAPADLGTLTASTGVILKEDTDDALATVVTDASGAAVLALDTSIDGTVHVMAAVGALCATASAAITGN